MEILRNKTGGVVTSTVMGIGGLIVGVIIIFVITSTLLNASLFTDTAATASYDDQTVTAVNETGSYFGNYSRRDAVCTLTEVTNATGGEIAANNYTATAATCLIVLADGGDVALNNTAWIINSTTAYTINNAEDAAQAAQGNMSSGVDNISKKIPTILLIVAVVFLFGALVLLVRHAKSMGVGAGSSL